MDNWIDEWMEREIQTGGWNSSKEAEMQAYRLRFKPAGSDSSLEAEIQAYRLDWSLEALISLRKPTWPSCARSIGDLIPDYKWMICVRDHTRSDSQLHLFLTRLMDLLCKTHVSNRNVQFYDWFGFSSSQDPFPRLPEYWFYWFYLFYWFFAGFIVFFEESICFAE